MSIDGFTPETETRIPLRWHDGWGYRCPRCKLFVALPQRLAPVYCPRCVVEPASPSMTDEDAMRTRLQPRLDEADAEWVMREFVVPLLNRLAALDER